MGSCMMTIIAGSRSATKEQVFQAIEESGWAERITQVISGHAAKGGDYWGEQWAKVWGVPILTLEADWYNLYPDPDYGIPVSIHQRFGAKYDNAAGVRRNERMVRIAEALIYVRIDNSRGTSDVLQRASARHLLIFGIEYKKGELCAST